MSNVSIDEMHGKMGSKDWKPPKLVAKSDKVGRPE